MSIIPTNLQAVQDHINATAHSVSRDPATIHLIAVSKTCSAQAIIEAAHAGQRAFGENYEQEAIDKMAQIQAIEPNLDLEWHYIGSIQSNKTRAIAKHFDWVHSVDRERIARRLSEQRPDNLPSLNICIQVNISNETTKSGLALEEARKLAHAVASLPKLKLRGLMAIPEPELNSEKQREPFRQLKQLFNQLNAEGLNMDTLSMGMTADMDAAIAEGATIVRIGTAIFGARDYHAK